MKKKLHDFLLKSGSHHVALHHAHEAAMNECEADSAQHTFHKTAAQAHADMASECLDACKTLAAADASDFEKVFERDYSQLVPSNVSAVVPTAPGRITAVPRAGAPPAASVPDVSPEFQKLFSLDDGS